MRAFVTFLIPQIRPNKRRLSNKWKQIERMRVRRRVAREEVSCLVCDGSGERHEWQIVRERACWRSREWKSAVPDKCHGLLLQVATDNGNTTA